MKRWKRLFVTALVGLYPARWKREYGAEFGDVLMRRRLNVFAVADAVQGAMAQQLRLGEPWLIIGLPWLMLNLAMIVGNILHPGPYVADSFEGGLAGFAAASLLHIAVGAWTVQRDPVNGHGGRAAFKNQLLIGGPLCVVALLAGLGVLRLIVLGPGDDPTSFAEHGLAFTLYDQKRRAVAWMGLFVLPLLELPYAALAGWVGGLAVRGYARLQGSRNRI